MTKLLLSLVLTSLMGCNSGLLGFAKKSDTNTDGEALPRSTGCLAGVVEDGITGARVDLAAAGRTDDFFVLISDTQKYASPLLYDGEAAGYPHLVGEYTLCGVPVESSFPLYVSIPGYQTFESVVLIPSSDAARGAGAEKDVLSQVPTLQANIRVFPLNPAGKNYQVIVSFNGAPLEGAAVELIPTGGNVVGTVTGNFLSPVPTGYKTLQATTDATGTATFNAADLALGALYRYVVLPVDPSLQKAGAGTVSIGYVDGSTNPYVLHVDLAQVNSELVIVSRSNASNHYSEDGSITFIFNRSIELVPGSLDGAKATLSGAQAAELAVDVPGNEASEQVDVSISGQTLTLKPKFKTKPDPDKEGGIGITYQGVTVRPVTGQKLLHVISVTGSVKFFGGQNRDRIPASIIAAAGDDQNGSPGETLPTMLAAQVLDSDANPVPGKTVTFTVTSGGGSVLSATAVTDSQGMAKTSWTLGMSGSQAVVASVDALQVTFHATFTINSLTVDQGDGQTGILTGPLPQPLVVTARDANNGLVVGGQVTFQVDGANWGKVKALGSAGSGAEAVTVLTDANGQAKVTWIMSAVAGMGYTVTASAGIAEEQFTADNVAATFALESGDVQTAGVGTELTNPLVVSLKNGGTGLAGFKIRFTTAGGGAFGPTSGTANTATTIEVTTDANGEAQTFWKLGPGTGAQTTTVEIVDTPGTAALTFNATGT